MGQPSMPFPPTQPNAPRKPFETRKFFKRRLNSVQASDKLHLLKFSLLAEKIKNNTAIAGHITANKKREKKKNTAFFHIEHVLAQSSMPICPLFCHLQFIIILAKMITETIRSSAPVQLQQRVAVAVAVAAMMMLAVELGK